MRGLYRSDDGRVVKSTVFLTDLEKQKEFLNSACIFFGFPQYNMSTDFTVILRGL